MNYRRKLIKLLLIFFLSIAIAVSTTACEHHNSIMPDNSNSTTVLQEEQDELIKSTKPSDFVLMGKTLIKSHKFELAIKNFEKAISLDPDCFLAYRYLGTVYLVKKENKKALICFEKAANIENNPDFYVDLLYQANILYELGDINRASDLFQEVLNVYPDNYMANNGLGIINTDKKQPVKAKEYFLKSIKSNPDFALSYYNLGRVYIKEKNYDEAIKNLEIAIYLEPTLAEAFSNLGVAYENKKNNEKAIKYYLRAIELNPELVAAQHNLKKIQQKAK